MPGKTDGIAKRITIYVEPEDWSWIVKAQRGSGVPREDIMRFIVNHSMQTVRKACKDDPGQLLSLLRAVVEMYREKSKAN